MRKLVKINHVSNLSDARYCAGMGADMLGFALVPDHPHYVNAATLHAITAWVSGVKIVGEINKACIPHTFFNDYVVNMIQITEYFSSHILDTTLQKSINTIQKIHISHATAAASLEETIFSHKKFTIDYFLITSDAPSDVQKNLQKQVATIAQSVPIIQSFNITADTIEDILALPIQGIALDGEKEMRAGYKSYEKMALILEKVMDYNQKY